MDFALSACRRHAAGLDLVSLGASATGGEELRALSSAARQTGAPVYQVRLPQGEPEALRDYVCSHPSLIYLVATVTDDLARELAERILRTTGAQVVLVGGQAPRKSTSLFAA